MLTKESDTTRHAGKHREGIYELPYQVRSLSLFV
jgi:hypothetical protein